MVSMKESKDNLSLLVRRATKLFRESLSIISPEEKLERDARRAALESVQLFVEADTQTTKAEFNARSKNVINLDTEKIGSILRVTLKTSWHRTGYQEPVGHRWYVVGRDPNQKTYVWEIGQESTGRIPQQGGELRIPQDDIELTRLKRIKRHVFNPRTISYNFHRIPRELEVPLKVDRMWGGTTEKSPNPTESRIHNALKQLTPVPQSI